MKSLLYAFVIILVFPIYSFSQSQQGETVKTNFQMGLVEGLDTLGLETGDLVFFQSKTFEGKMIQLGTFSRYTHTAMIIRDSEGVLWITHATDNVYDGHGIPVKDEEKSRGGVIMTKLKNAFLISEKYKDGFYKRIRIFKLREELVQRPSIDTLLSMYEKYKILPFEESRLRFVLSSIDLRINGKDLFAQGEKETMICSEYIYLLLEECNFPLKSSQLPHEYTPIGLKHLIEDLYFKPIVYQFDNGAYKIKG